MLTAWCRRCSRSLDGCQYDAGWNDLNLLVSGPVTGAETSFNHSGQSPTDKQPSCSIPSTAKARSIVVGGIGKCRSKCVRRKRSALRAFLPDCLRNEQVGKGRFGLDLLCTVARIVYLEGTVSDDLSSLLLSLPLCDAGRFHHLAAVGMEKIGYKVKRNQLVPNRGDGRRGKIDIVARRNSEVIALELDHVAARTKSLYKIRHFKEATARIVVCRYSEPTMGRYEA